MALSKVIGIQQFDFISDKDSQRITGTKYHVISIPEGKVADNTRGYLAETFTVSFDKLQSLVSSQNYVPQMGDVIQVAFDRRGRADFFFKIDNDPFSD